MPHELVHSREGPLPARQSLATLRLRGLNWLKLVLFQSRAALRHAIITQRTQREIAFGKIVDDVVQEITQSGNTYIKSGGGRFVVVVSSLPMISNQGTLRWWPAAILITSVVECPNSRYQVL